MAYLCVTFNKKLSQQRKRLGNGSLARTLDVSQFLKYEYIHIWTQEAFAINVVEKTEREAFLPALWL